MCEQAMIKLRMHTSDGVRVCMLAFFFFVCTVELWFYECHDDCDKHKICVPLTCNCVNEKLNWLTLSYVILSFKLFLNHPSALRCKTTRRFCLIFGSFAFFPFNNSKNVDHGLSQMSAMWVGSMDEMFGAKQLNWIKTKNWLHPVCSDVSV